MLKANDIKVFIIQLVKLFDNNWTEDQKISIFLTSIDQKDAPDTSLNPSYILITSLYKANFIDPRNFIFATQLNIKESEIYK